MHHRDAALAVTNLAKTFAGTRALAGLDLTIQPGEVHAVVGENGSGKSTLIKIISGFHKPDPGGRVAVGGHVLHSGSPESAHAAGARFVHQDLGLIPTLSVADNLCLTVGYPAFFGTVRRSEARRLARESLARLGLALDPDVMVAALAPAEKTGVAVARTLMPDPHSEVKLLVLDEPTASLPDDEVERLLGIVRALAHNHVGVLYISHRIEEIFQIADVATVLRDGRKVSTTAVAALTRRQLVEDMVGTELADAHHEAESLWSDYTTPVLQVENLTTEALDGVTFDVDRGQVLGLAGITGSGRGSVCGAIFGSTRRLSGKVRVKATVLPEGRPEAAIRLGCAYLSAERHADGGFMGLTARENLTITDLAPFWRRAALRRGIEKREAARWLAEYSVRPADTELALGAFSGGNQQKILLAKWLRCNPDLLLLDEPTQGVDVGAKAELHHQLLQAAARGAAVVVSSTDAEELAAICHTVLVLRNGKITGTLTGSRLTAAGISRESLIPTEVSS